MSYPLDQVRSICWMVLPLLPRYYIFNPWPALMPYIKIQSKIIWCIGSPVIFLLVSFTSPWKNAEKLSGYFWFGIWMSKRDPWCSVLVLFSSLSETRILSLVNKNHIKTQPTKQQLCHPSPTRKRLQISFDEKGPYSDFLLTPNFLIQTVIDFVYCLIKINTKKHNVWNKKQTCRLFSVLNFLQSLLKHKL